MGERQDGPPDVVHAALVAFLAQIAHSKAFLAIPPPDGSLAFPRLGEESTGRCQTAQKDAPAAAAVHVAGSMADDSGALLSPAQRVRSRLI